MSSVQHGNRWSRLAALLSLAWIYAAPVTAETLDAIKQTVRKKFPSVRQMTSAELAARLADDSLPRPLLVDARGPEEFEVSHLPGAKNLRSLAEVKAALPSNSHPVVVYCSLGYRSSALAEKLQRGGLTNVANLEGSIFQWANERRPLFRGATPVQQVHPYNRKWGQLLDRKLWWERDRQAPGKRGVSSKM